MKTTFKYIFSFTEYNTRLDEWLSDIYNIGYDYDGYHDAKNLMELIDELLEMVCKARKCLWQGKLFGVYGSPEEKDEEAE